MTELMENLPELNRKLQASTNRWHRLSIWLYFASLPGTAMLALWFAREGDAFAILAGSAQGVLIWSGLDLVEMRHKAGLGTRSNIPRGVWYLLASLGTTLMVIVLFYVRQSIILPWWFAALAGMFWSMGMCAIRQLIIERRPRA